MNEQLEQAAGSAAADGFSPGDMATAQAEGFRAGVAHAAAIGADAAALLSEARMALEMVRTNERVRSGSKGRAWDGAFVAAEVDRLIEAIGNGLGSAAEQPATAVDNGLALIAAECRGHVFREGWTPEHDDEHTSGQLAQAAGCYALAYALTAQGHGQDVVPSPWPWTKSWWKPTPENPVCQLVKAGSLIVAEIDRLLRAKGSHAKQSEPRHD